MSTEKVVVVAVDNSNECLKAVDFVKSHFPGYTYNLVHVQTHSVPAPFTADVSTRPDRVAYDADGHAFDTNTKLDKEQVATTEHFLNQVFKPRAGSEGAQVHATLLHTGGDSSRSVGDALCRFVAKIQPAALVIMKENKSAVVQFFLGSVSRFCASHSTAPVIIVPA